MKSQRKAYAIFVGVTGALLATAVTAGSAQAQAKSYPDGTNCSLLSDAELVRCQNQIYARQLESGVSNQEAEPAAVPSSHIEGNEANLPDFVPGAEGTEPPTVGTPIATPDTLYSFEGPEGARIHAPTE